MSSTKRVFENRWNFFCDENYFDSFFFLCLLPFVSAGKYMVKVFKIVQVYFDGGNCYLFIYFLEILQISCVFGNLLNLSILS